MVRTGDKTQEFHPRPSQSLHNHDDTPQNSLKERLDTGKSDNYRLFEKIWASSTEDNNLTLHGFRRFKTTHLFNLRLLEEEIDRIDHQIYQAGLKLGMDPTPVDRLGLRHCKKDEHSLSPEEVMDERRIQKLRDLLNQYGKCHAPSKRNVLGLNFDFWCR